ncbi:hypothetical protein AA313_de0204056 [Arthrobotrys entomopaga]|nr:hypothetical protein AA313_de0204056 [Arthrobotrys entomopaga]
MKSATLLSALVLAFGVAQAAPYPYDQPVERAAPSIPSGEEAKAKLAKIRVEASTSGDGYNRKLFPHWKEQPDGCNTREDVLKRDGTKVQVDKKCAATAGTWVCPYSGKSFTKSSDIDIDHMVPLKNAWISGASSWTTKKRGEFANDLKNPQLWAVNDRVNVAKSASSPDKWKPVLTSFYCTYASAWVEVKSVWDLTITDAEKATLGEMLDTCGGNSTQPAGSRL